MSIKPSQRPPEFWERIGREACRLDGVDPDLRVRLPNGGQAVALSGPAWKVAAAEIRRLLILAEAYDTVEDEVDMEIREARFGEWMPTPPDGSAPPLPVGRAYEVRRRDGDDEFYAADALGPSRWYGEDKWSLVQYRVEKESPPEVKE